MAITAWSAKVETSSTCFSVKGSTVLRPRKMTPIGCPDRRRGTPSRVRNPAAFCCSGNAYSGSARTSGICTALPSSSTRPTTLPRPGYIRTDSEALVHSGEKLYLVAWWWPPPSASSRVIAAISALQSFAADSVSVSRTGCRSNAERLMTLSTSAVAVCCCRDSRKSSVRACTSSNSRTFSMAITAWSAKVWSN